MPSLEEEAAMLRTELQICRADCEAATAELAQLRHQLAVLEDANDRFDRLLAAFAARSRPD